MGWKGTLRSVQASIRHSEREAERRQKYRAKIQQRNNAENTVYEQEKYIKRISRMHTHCVAKKIDWEALSRQDPPLMPKRMDAHESAAKYKYENFKPSIIHKIFRLIDKKKKSLWEFIEESTKKNEHEYQVNLKQYLGVLV